MDSISFLQHFLIEKYPFEIVQKIIFGRRKSTKYQPDIAWEASLSWSRENIWLILINLDTAFLLSIAPGYFQLQTAVVYILEKALNVGFSKWEFKAMENAIFI